MIIQFNTDNNVTGNEKVTAPLIEAIKKSMDRFSNQITRIEVHLTDEDGNKGGLNDKRCMMEARITGMQPIAVTNHGDTHQQAVNGAIDKLKSSLESAIGRLKNH
jgi:ribosome-associated translation inhibitor RaiA